MIFNVVRQGVKSVHDPLWRSTFEDVYAAPAFQRRWYIVGGNHDDYQNASAQIEYTKHSSRWFFPHFYYSETLFREEEATHTAASHQSRTLKLDESSSSPPSASAVEGDSAQQPLPPPPPPPHTRKLHPLIDMIFLDSQMLVGPGGDTAQYRWFADAVDASDADFLLVVSHYPVFSGGMRFSRS
jgi:hypothetical protein